MSESRRRVPDQRVAAWRDTVSEHDLFLSVLVLGEIHTGIERLRPRDPIGGRSLESWAASLASQFADRILPVTREIAESWGRLQARAPFPVVDGLMAATALAYGLTVVTRDTGPFEIAGVQTLDPWSS